MPTLTKRAHVILPVDLVADIDKLVGKRGRSAFIAEVTREEILRRRQRAALARVAGVWKDKDHPELKDGSVKWVEQMRNEAEDRFQKIERGRNSD